MIGAVLGAVTMLRLMNLGGSIAPGALRLRVVDIIVQTKDNDINCDSCCGWGSTMLAYASIGSVRMSLSTLCSKQ